jgi:hypothetical protein
MGDPVRRVRVERLTAQAWTPFGWLPVSDADPQDGGGRLFFEWGDPHVNVICHSAGEVVRSPGGLVCTEMFRHDTHTQALLVLDAPAVVAVAPAHVEFESPAEALAIHAFSLDPLQAFVLHRGTWHWGPFPLDTDRVHLFNVQGRRYLEDNRRVELGELVGLVELSLPPAPSGEA